MDVQRKKGILEVCVLAVLKKGPSYGYLIIRELERCVDISESTLYPILKRLEQGGSLETYRMEYNGRMRKYYRLTQGGQRKIDAFLGEWDELRTMYQFVAEQNAKEPEVEIAEQKPADAESKTIETGTQEYAREADATESDESSAGEDREKGEEE